MDIVQSKRGHAVYAIEDTCATGISTTRYFFFFLFNREPLASEKITCFYVYGASAQLGEPRFHAVRVDQSDHGEDARSTYASFGTQKTKHFSLIKDAKLAVTPSWRLPS